MLATRRQVVELTTLLEQLRAEQQPGLEQYVGRTVIAHHQGPSIRGVLVDVHRDVVVLRHAESLDDDAELAGESVVQRAHGFWLQVPTEEPTP